MRAPETRDIVILAIKIAVVIAILTSVIWVNDVVRDLEEISNMINQEQNE